MIPKEEISTIKECYRLSVHPKAIAHYYKTTLEEITDILGLPRDLKEMEKLHREKNFYDHGHGDAIPVRMEHYSLYLDDGDFEKYQKYCYMSHWNPKFWIMKWWVNRMKESTLPTIERRRMWILMRFEDYQGEKWSEMEEKNKILNTFL